MSRLTITEVKPNEHYLFLAWLICIVGALFYCYEYILRISPSIMSTDLMHFFNLSAYQYGDLTAYYYYAYTPIQLVVGLLMDRYGPRRLLMIACLTCTAGAFIFAHSHLLVLVKLSRFLIGFGSAFAFVGALKLASIWLPPERFASVSGGITSLGMIGAMTGDIALSHLVGHYGWRMTISMSAWAGVVLTILILVIVHDKLKAKEVSYVPQLSFYDLFTSLLKSLKNPYIWINGLTGLILFLPITAFAELWGIPYLTTAYHLNHFNAAIAISLIFLGWAIGAPFNGWLSDITAKRKLPLKIGSFSALIIICIILYISNIPVLLLCLLLFLFGITTSTQIVVFAISRELSSRYIAATAVSLTNAFVMLGGAIFQPVIGRLLDYSWKGNIINIAHVYNVHNYKLALSILPISLSVCVVLTFLLKEPHYYKKDKIISTKQQNAVSQ